MDKETYKIEFDFEDKVSDDFNKLNSELKGINTSFSSLSNTVARSADKRQVENATTNTVMLPIMNNTVIKETQIKKQLIEKQVFVPSRQAVREVVREREPKVATSSNEVMEAYKKRDEVLREKIKLEQQVASVTQEKIYAIKQVGIINGEFNIFKDKATSDFKKVYARNNQLISANTDIQVALEATQNNVENQAVQIKNLRGQIMQLKAALNASQMAKGSTSPLSYSKSGVIGGATLSNFYNEYPNPLEMAIAKGRR
jgi:hypothetical protein